MRYFISDLHFFHKNILKFGQRDQFVSLEEMHEHIINNWNKRVNKKDLVYIIGDFSFGKFAETRDVLQKLNGEKILIRGNHDNLRTAEYINAGFKDVRDECYIKIEKTRVLLKHYPYHKPIRHFFKSLLGRVNRRNYEVFYPVNRGLWHIHGHHHGGPSQGLEINVSCETLNYIPLSETEVMAHIQANPT